MSHTFDNFEQVAEEIVITEEGSQYIEEVDGCSQSKRPRQELKEVVTKPIAKIWKIIRSLLCFVNGEYTTKLEQLIQVWMYGTTDTDLRELLEEMLDITMTASDRLNPCSTKAEVISYISAAADESSISSYPCSRLNSAIRTLQTYCKGFIDQHRAQSSLSASTSSQASTTCTLSMTAPTLMDSVDAPGSSETSSPSTSTQQERFRAGIDEYFSYGSSENYDTSISSYISRYNRDMCCTTEVEGRKGTYVTQINMYRVSDLADLPKDQWWRKRILNAQYVLQDGKEMMLLQQVRNILDKMKSSLDQDPKKKEVSKKVYWRSSKGT